MKNGVVLLDGAVGTSLWAKTDNKVPVWRYNLENPAIVSELHREYVDAGCEIILANTFGANRMALKKSDYKVRDVVSEAVRLANEAARGKAKVALSVGPLPALLEPYGDLGADEAFEIFDEQISAGVSQKPDIIALQTFMDIEMLKIAARAAVRYDLPLFCMMTFGAVGKTMMGNSVRDMAEGLREFPVRAIGMNCSIGPEKAVPVIREFSECTDLPLIFKPNAGKPVTENGESRAQFDIEDFVRDSIPALSYGVKYIGGCCGSNVDYIRALKAAAENIAVPGKEARRP